MICKAIICSSPFPFLLDPHNFVQLISILVGWHKLLKITASIYHGFQIYDHQINWWAGFNFSLTIIPEYHAFNSKDTSSISIKCSKFQIFQKTFLFLQLHWWKVKKKSTDICTDPCLCLVFILRLRLSLIKQIIYW